MRQISGRDAVFLYLGRGGSASTVMSCNIVQNPDGEPLHVTPGDLAAWALERIHINDLFRSKLVRLPGEFALPYWVHDDDFAITDHIEIHRPGNRDWRSVRTYLARLADRPLNLSRPPWIMHVIPDVEGFPDHEGLASIVAIQCHHAAFDGMTLGLISAQIFGDATLICPEVVVGDDVVPRAALIRREVARLPAVGYGFIAAAIVAFRKSRRERAAAAARPNAMWPATRFNGAFRGPRAADLVSLPLEQVLEMKARVAGATVNDLMLSIIGEALKGYLEAHGEPAAGSLSSLVPVATRSQRHPQTLNQFTFIVANMHTDEPDRTARLQKIAADTGAEKARVAADYVEPTGTGMIESTPAPVLRMLAYLNRRGQGRPSHPTQAPFNTVVSNVRTSHIERKILGYNIVNGFAIQPITTGTTLAHAVLNRLDRVNISFTVDSSVMADTSEYSDLLRSSFQAHHTALR